MKNYDWIVVGAGITGAAIAYELAKTGFSVLLLEQHGIPENATRYSYGGLAYWSGTTPLTRQLCEEAIALYQNLNSELDAETELRELDLLLTIAADSDLQAAAASYNHLAIGPQLLNIKEACELEPLLNPEAIAGALTVKHGHINPTKTTQGYIQAFLRAGGKMQIAQVLDLQTTSSSNPGMKLKGVQTNIDTYYSDNVVVCAGGFSRRLLKLAGIPMKLYFTHAEVIETPPVELSLRTLIMPANLQRFQLEAESTKVGQLWQIPLVIVPPLARRFANFLAGKEDEIITQLSPGR
ncbi:NAD(P)/FAD-dependent oxidoreductase [Nodularia spumigena]|uniref:NAD(P)/FAD-dependent oxidoreductase n=1 Tax=Nodularia spumigena TaxID=70799 RepID=UPI00232F3978|nr:FAD-binding oxidoreductase [Nodularia spumigena]MDB9348383.1 FAD-binding oxidoreductase [Nodularia spumigena CS-588/01]MDB9350976.1 FAD-binding oxidoreductase [Nodularia spumigena CS-588/05]